MRPAKEKNYYCDGKGMGRTSEQKNEASEDYGLKNPDDDMQRQSHGWKQNKVAILASTIFALASSIKLTMCVLSSRRHNGQDILVEPSVLSLSSAFPNPNSTFSCDEISTVLRERITDYMNFMVDNLDRQLTESEVRLAEFKFKDLYNSHADCQDLYQRHAEKVDIIDQSLQSGEDNCTNLKMVLQVDISYLCPSTELCLDTDDPLFSTDAFRDPIQSQPLSLQLHKTQSILQDRIRGKRGKDSDSTMTNSSLVDRKSVLASFDHFVGVLATEESRKVLDNTTLSSTDLWAKERYLFESVDIDFDHNWDKKSKQKSKGKKLKKQSKKKSKGKKKSKRKKGSGKAPVSTPAPVTPAPVTPAPIITDDTTAPSVSNIPSEQPSISQMPSLSSVPSEQPSNTEKPSMSSAPSTSPSQTIDGVDKLDAAIARGIMRPSSSECSNAASTTTFEDQFTSTDSISSWVSVNDQYEDDAFQVDISHKDPTDSNRDWSLRIGKGGQIMSLIGPYGESIANQARDISIWNDLVQQLVATRGGAVGGFIHGSGPYARPDLTPNAMPPPFYNPMVALECSGNQCTSVNWGSQSLGADGALVASKLKYRSDLLFYQRYTNCGNGVIEVDYFIHHFGDKSVFFDYFNTPWTGVRATTFKSMMVADTSKTLQNEWPLYDWGGRLQNLDNTGGFTTFAQHIEHNPAEADRVQDLWCHNSSDGNKLTDCSNTNNVVYEFKVVADGAAGNAPNDPTTPEGASFSRKRWDICPTRANAAGNRGAHPPDGFIFRNKRTNYELEVISISHSCLVGTQTMYLMTEASRNTINANFLQDDVVEIFYAPATGKPEADNLSLTFVHGTNPEFNSNRGIFKAKSRVRYGMAGNLKRDGIVWTTNYQGTLSFGDTYFNRKYMISGNYLDAPGQADPLISETIEDKDAITYYASQGEVIKLYNYAASGSFGATVGAETCAETSAVEYCVGSSAPKSGSSPLFYITCNGASVVTFDLYHFDPFINSNYQPWLCDINDASLRPEWKMLGYFPTSQNPSCQTLLGTLTYDSNLC